MSALAFGVTRLFTRKVSTLFEKRRTSGLPAPSVRAVFAKSVPLGEPIKEPRATVVWPGMVRSLVTRSRVTRVCVIFSCAWRRKILKVPLG